MYKPTAYATLAGRDLAMHRIVPIRPNVATGSASHWPGPVRTVVDSCITGWLEHGVRKQHPHNRPRHLASLRTTDAVSNRQFSPQSETTLTAGLRWAPEIGPSASTSTMRIAPVASVLPSKASAALPPASSFRHDSGTDDCGEKKCAAYCFGGDDAGKEKNSRVKCGRFREADSAS